MKYAEITIVVELSEDIASKEAEVELMDDITDTLVDTSLFVLAVRSIGVKDCTKECETA